MRIIAGSASGRRLMVPVGDATRPTTDRVREATFNALFSMNLIDDLTFCDLFAGSGALGLEALSRGAGQTIFVERDRAALEAIEANIATLDFGDRSRVVKADSMRWLETAAAVDVLLADPPYGFDDWQRLGDVANATVIVAESGHALDEIAGWDVARARAYGSSVVTILRRQAPPVQEHRP